MVSHELRTPLGAILGWTDVLKKGLVDDTSRDRALEAIHRNAQQQVQLLGELLDAARIKSGTLQLKYESVDLEALVRDAWETWRLLRTRKVSKVASTSTRPDTRFTVTPRACNNRVESFLERGQSTPAAARSARNPPVRWRGRIVVSTMDGASLQSSCRWSLSRFGKLTTRKWPPGRIRTGPVDRQTPR